MRTSKIYIFAAVFISLLALNTIAFGQIIYGQPASAKIRFSYTNWSVEYTPDSTYSVSQLMIPVNGFVPIKDNLEMRYYFATTSNSVELHDGTKNSLSGMADARIQINHSFSNDRFLLSAGLNLPTGKKELNLGEDQIVMGFLSENYLAFPIRRLGEGPGLNLMIGTATAKDNSRLGASAIFHYFGKYTPYENQGEYNPGEMFGIIINADTKKDNILLQGAISFSYFTDDKVDDLKLRRPSNQFDIMAGIQSGNAKVTFSGNTRMLIRGRMTSYDSNEELFDQLRLYGNEFGLSGSLAYHPQETWSFTPSAQLRLIGGNEYEDEYKQEGSTIFGFGGDYARNIGTGVDIMAGMTYFIGNADGGDISLNGFYLTGGLTAAF